MPTYKNATDSIQVAYGAIFKPQEIVALDMYLPEEDTRFERISDSPCVRSPILFSGSVTDDTVALPFYNGVITVSAVAPEDDSANLYFADDAVPVVLDGAGYEITANWRKLGKVRVEGTASIVAEIAKTRR